MLLLACLSMLVLSGGTEPRPEDSVELKSGKKLDGYVLLENDARLVLRIGSREQDIESKEIAAVRSANRTLATVLDRLDAMPDGEVGGRMDLARYCQDNKLPGEAAVLALAALAVDPKLADAHTFLEHVRRGERWYVKRDSRTLPFEDLAQAQQNFREPWKLRTAHFELLTNLSLRDAVDAALDLERFYRAFFGLFVHDLAFYEVVEPISVGIYGDSRSFPEGAVKRIAYFDPQANQMLVNAENGLDRGALFHEGTHALLYNTAEHTRAGRGRIPGWLDEGLAEYVGNAATGDPGQAKFSFGERLPYHFAAHRTADKPYDLGRVLNFESGDFLGTSHTDLKYAESYTLVHFCMHGDADRYRLGFMRFMKLAYEGKSSSSDFKDALSIKEREFEKAWNVHVGRKP